VQDRYRVSERRSCAVLRFDRKTHRYRSVRGDQAQLRSRIKEIAEARVRYGYRRIHVLLRREGWAVNVKRVRRLYRMEGLNLRAKHPRRHVMAARRVERPLASRPNEIWAMDFVSDALFNGRRFRALTVVDAFTRECLVIEVDQGIRGEQVVDVMDRLLFERGGARRTRSGWTIGPSSSPGRSTIGPTSTGLRWTSAGQASRPTMPSWNPSTDDSGTSA
jgi:putative transposase